MIKLMSDEAKKLYKEAERFARTTGQIDNFKENMDYLSGYACHEGRETRCEMYQDGAPYSFYFVMHLKRKGEDEFKPWFNGGLIYHGPHDGFGDGGAPTFSVNINNSQGWSVYT